MMFQKSMKKVIEAHGFKHSNNDDHFTRHGEYARHIQYAFSKEHIGDREKIVDLIFLGADLKAEAVVVAFFRENISIENGVLESADFSIPLTKFSVELFEKKLNRLIPTGSPLLRGGGKPQAF
jgi:hypothetical protein